MSSPSLEEETETNGEGGDPLRLQSREISQKMNTDFFSLAGLDPKSVAAETSSSASRDSRQMCSDSWSGSNCLEDLTYVTNKTTFDPRGGGTGGGDPSRLDPNDDGYGGVLTRESWMIPMLALAAVNVIVILTFEVYVVCKAAKNTPSRRHLFLGQMLLLGLLIGSVVGFAYAVQPSDFSCAVIRFGTGLSYALIYSSLVVKLVFLISLNTGVYLPATYQALLFLFCILVQLVIGIQWLATNGALCHFSTRDHILALLYVIFLIMFATSLAVKSRRFRDNYREAKYIGVLLAISIPIWMAWIMASIVLHESFHSACVGFGLLIICSVTFIIMFLPKSRQLSAIGKEGIYIEDQEVDRFSLHSDRYSPSFYHFKPNKTIMSAGGGGGPHQGSLYKEHHGGGHQAGGYGGGGGGHHHRPESPFHRPGGNSYTGLYSRPDVESLNIYTSLHDDRMNSEKNPNVYFYKTNQYHQPGFIY